MKKVFLGAVLVLGLISIANASEVDILSTLTKGKISDTSAGVKVLSLEEKKQVKGGYITGYLALSSNEVAVLAITTVNARDAGVHFGDRDGSEIRYDKNGNYVSSKSGLCGADLKTCGFLSQRKLNDFMQVAGDPVLNALGYSVKRNIRYNRQGKPYVVFTYGVVVYNLASKTTHRINSSQALNNNMVIKELSSGYKETLERLLGGWSVR